MKSVVLMNGAEAASPTMNATSAFEPNGSFRRSSSVLPSTGPTVHQLTRMIAAMGATQ